MNSSINILFYYPYGRGLTGGPRFLLNLLERLDKTRFRPIVVSQKQSPLTEEAEVLGCQKIIVPFPSILNTYNEGILQYSVVNKLNSLKALLEYNKKIEDLAKKYNINCFWGRNIKSVLLIGIAAKRLNIPLIWDIGIEKESRGLMRLLHWIGLNLTSAVVTQAFCQQQEIFGAMTVQLFKSKFFTIYPGVNASRLDKIQVDKYNVRKNVNQFTIISVGTITPRKNQRMLLKAIQLITQKHPHIHANIVGSVDDEAYFKECQDFVQNKKIEPYVTFLGWRDDILELMLQSDLLVFTSQNEGIPQVIKEAMQVELPVVSTSVGGIPEIIKHQETGLLVAKDDVHQLSQSIESCITNPELCRQLSQKARLRVEQQFSAQIWSSEYEKLFCQLCKL